MSRKRAIIYTRINRASEEALKVQHSACLGFCQRFDMEVVGTLLDVDPGLELTNRPQIDELRQMIQAHHIDVVVVYTLDRLSRELGNVAVITNEAETAGVEIISVIGGIADSFTPFAIIATSQERERLAWLLRNSEYREQERWQKQA